ncbi:unnamed protein product [Adineta steineri]|uniref:Uncharacterized protein n=1 Tax=Adineta steineri TaxID=433720 RepID=A0A813YEY4_9BILA|nr:unnamed protein product [Adineta steineri]CAF0886651.1 unnamed protein product [Adineta steineri]CAF1164964.1 unnamed protein product [Adineta steineri]
MFPASIHRLQNRITIEQYVFSITRTFGDRIVKSCGNLSLPPIDKIMLIELMVLHRIYVGGHLCNLINPITLLNGQPTPEVVQTASNDLPTIYPLSVTVTATSTLYIITFPPEMDNVLLLTCISTSTNPPNVTEIVQGVASGSQIAFEFDGQLTEYIGFTNNSINSSKLQSTFNEVFSIQCPISLNNI